MYSTKEQKEEAAKELQGLEARKNELVGILNAPEKQTKEEAFLIILDGLEIKIDKEKYPESTFFLKGEKLFFELINERLWCSWPNVWSIFSKDYLMNYNENQQFIKEQMGEHFKMKGVTP